MGWINTQDALPDEGARVLVYTEHSMYGKGCYLKRDITIGEFRDGKWKCANYLGNRVIAWMPLPNKPEEG